LIELAVGNTLSPLREIARPSVRSTIATPITPSNRSTISPTRASSFFHIKSSLANADSFAVPPFPPGEDWGEGFSSPKGMPTNNNATIDVADFISGSLFFVRKRSDSIKAWALNQAAAQPALWEKAFQATN